MFVDILYRMELFEDHQKTLSISIPPSPGTERPPAVSNMSNMTAKRKFYFLNLLQPVCMATSAGLDLQF